MTNPELFGPLFTDPAVAAELSDAALLRAMLDAEAALARAQASVGVIPVEAAEAIVAACTNIPFDVGSIGARSVGGGNPVIPLVRDLTGAVPEAARPWVHHGATSQDILDTALSLVSCRALVPVLAAARRATDTAADLADRHRATLMVGRTLGQQAAPTTFGLVAAGWVEGLDRAVEALCDARGRLAAQLGGPVGTLAALGGSGPAVLAGFAATLELAAPALPWHTDRQRMLDLSAALGRVAAAVGKIAVDVVWLGQTEVGELAEGGPGRGGSSSMPHKRNPVDAVLVTSATRRVPGLVATMFTAAIHEHQRATGSWHAEWPTLVDLVGVVGGATARCADLLAGLRVDAARMRHNLDASGGVLMAESVATRLAPVLGRTRAHDAVARCCRNALDRGVPLRTALGEDPEVAAALPSAQIDHALDPSGWLGSADMFVTAALARYAAHRGTEEAR